MTLKGLGLLGLGNAGSGGGVDAPIEGVLDLLFTTEGKSLATLADKQLRAN